MTGTALACVAAVLLAANPSAGAAEPGAQKAPAAEDAGGPKKAPEAGEAKDPRRLTKALEALRQEQASADAVAAAREFQYRCVRSVGNSGFCRCLNARRPQGVDFDAFILFTSRSRDELGYERLTPMERKLVDGALAARDGCADLLGWD